MYFKILNIIARLSAVRKPAVLSKYRHWVMRWVWVWYGNGCARVVVISANNSWKLSTKHSSIAAFLSTQASYLRRSVAFLTLKKDVLYSHYFNGTPSHSYGESLVIWDHTVLPSTRHKWTHFSVTPAKPADTRFTYPGGMEGWVDLGDCLHTEMVCPPTDGQPSQY